MKSVIRNTSIFAFFLLIFSLSSCKTVSYYPVSAKIGSKSVTAINLEEDDYFFSTGNDEIHYQYTFAAMDANGNVVGRPVSGYEYMEFNRRGQTKYTYGGGDFRIPQGGSLFISVSLTEDDDYSNIIDMIDTGQEIAEMVEKARGSKNNKIRINSRYAIKMSRALNWLSIAFTVVDYFDTNDKLMVVCGVMDKKELKRFISKGETELKLRSSGRNNGDNFSYQVDLSLIAGEMWTAKPLKERVEKSKRVKTNKSYAKSLPDFNINFSPIFSIGNLNESWLNSNPAEDTGNSSQYDLPNFSDYDFGAYMAFNITPAFGGRKGGYKKLLLDLGYYKKHFYLNTKQEHFFTDFYFDNPSGNQFGFSYDQVTFETETASAGLTLRFFLKDNPTYIDIGGGTLTQNAKLSINVTDIDQADVQYNYDESLNILDRTFSPYGKLGVGINYKSIQIGIHLTGYAPQFNVNDNYQIFTATANGFEKTDFSTPNNLIYTTAVHFGLAF